MALVEGLRLMAKVVHLVCERGVSKAEMSNRLDQSQTTISVLFKHVLDKKIVPSSVTSPASFRADLRVEPQKTYNMRKTIVKAAGTDNDEKSIARILGIAGTFYAKPSKQREIIAYPYARVVSVWMNVYLQRDCCRSVRE